MQGLQLNRKDNSVGCRTPLWGPPQSIITSGYSERRHLAEGDCHSGIGSSCPWVIKSGRALYFKLQSLGLLQRLLLGDLAFGSLHGASGPSVPLLLPCPVQLRAIILIPPPLTLQPSCPVPFHHPLSHNPSPGGTQPLAFSEPIPRQPLEESTAGVAINSWGPTWPGASMPPPPLYFSHCVTHCVLQNSTFSPQSSDPHSSISSWLDPVPLRENRNPSTSSTRPPTPPASAHFFLHASAGIPGTPLCFLLSKASLSPVPSIPPFPTFHTFLHHRSSSLT